MLFIIDSRLPSSVKQGLSRYGPLLELKTEGITYEAISGHPDIFIFQARDRLITAPNLPDYFTSELKNLNIPFEKGHRPVGPAYPQTAGYNASVNGSVFIHRLDITDPAVLDSVSDYEKINVSQGYSRCNIIPLPNAGFITSDQGIHQELLNKGFKSKLYTGDAIILKGFPKGFIGGTCGTDGSRLYITGSLHALDNGDQLSEFIIHSGLELIELTRNTPIDCGCILTVAG